MRSFAIFLTHAVITGLLASCVLIEPPMVTRFSTVEITDLEGAPVTGVEVQFQPLETGDLRLVFREQGPFVTEPADDLGNIRIPVTYFASLSYFGSLLMTPDEVPLFEGTFRFFINQDENTETLEVANELGASSSGETFKVRVVSVETDPPLADPCITIDNGLAVVKIEGYLHSLSYRSTSAQDSCFGITSADSSLSYVDSVVIGEVPDGFRAYRNSCTDPSNVLDPRTIVTMNGILPKDWLKVDECLSGD